MKPFFYCVLMLALVCGLAGCVTGSALPVAETENTALPAIPTLTTGPVFLPLLDTTTPEMALISETPTSMPTVEIFPTPEGYPATPEDVTSAFLRAYQEDANLMFQYLTSSLQIRLPAGGVAELLGFEGVLDGFVIQSGSSGADPASATVAVNLQLNGTASQRVFYLVFANQMWQIDAVEINP